MDKVGTIREKIGDEREIFYSANDMIEVKNIDLNRSIIIKGEVKDIWDKRKFEKFTYIERNRILDFANTYRKKYPKMSIDELYDLAVGKGNRKGIKFCGRFMKPNGNGKKKSVYIINPTADEQRKYLMDSLIQRKRWIQSKEKKLIETGIYLPSANNNGVLEGKKNEKGNSKTITK